MKKERLKGRYYCECGAYWSWDFIQDVSLPSPGQLLIDMHVAKGHRETTAERCAEARRHNEEQAVSGEPDGPKWWEKRREREARAEKKAAEKAKQKELFSD